MKRLQWGFFHLCQLKKDVKTLQLTMKDYEAKDDWQLYLWKQNEDFVGIMGIVKKRIKFWKFSI